MVNIYEKILHERSDNCTCGETAALLIELPGAGAPVQDLFSEPRSAVGFYGPTANKNLLITTTNARVQHTKRMLPSRR